MFPYFYHIFLRIDSYLMGSGERLEIQSEITNSGEDAFNALLEVQLPRGVSYINANTTDPSVNILCSPPSVMNNNTVQCEVGNPLRANKVVTARIYVMPKSDEFHDVPVSEFSFMVSARSSNPEEGSEDDNMEVYTVPIRVETDFRVTGKSDPLEVEYNITAPLPDKYEVEDDIGEEVSHIYDVKNKGPSSISEAMVHIFWPSFNDHIVFGHVIQCLSGKFCRTFLTTSHVHDIDLVGNVDVTSDNGIGTHLKIDILVIQIVVVAVDVVGNGSYSIENGKSHAGKHEWNKLS